MEWKISSGFTDYSESLLIMKERVNSIRTGTLEELVWMLEYEPLYTAGSSAKDCELHNIFSFPVFMIGRGGKYTYHGPGQRVIYLILDLKKRNLCDLKKYIHTLEQIIIVTLDRFGIHAFRREGYVGIWVNTECTHKKIAAIGVRVSGWISYHGIAVNLFPNLDHYNGITPCGISEFGVTSIRDLGCEINEMQLFDRYFIESFDLVLSSKQS